MGTRKAKISIWVFCLFVLFPGAAPAWAVSPGVGSGDGALSSGTEGTARDPLSLSRVEINGEFLDLALDLRNPSSWHTVTKWARRAVSVKTLGDADVGSCACIAESIGEINSLAGSVSLVLGQGENPEIEVHFVTPREMQKVPGYLPGAMGFTWCESRKGLLQECSIWVPTEGVDDRALCTILRHEMLHAIGLLGHSEHPDSLLFQGTAARRFSALDREVIHLLYDPALPPGFTEQMVREYLS